MILELMINNEINLPKFIVPAHERKTHASFLYICLSMSNVTRWYEAL